MLFCLDSDVAIFLDLLVFIGSDFTTIQLELATFEGAEYVVITLVALTVIDEVLVDYTSQDVVQLAGVRDFPVVVIPEFVSVSLFDVRHHVLSRVVRDGQGHSMRRAVREGVDYLDRPSDLHLRRRDGERGRRYT